MKDFLEAVHGQIDANAVAAEKQRQLEKAEGRLLEAIENAANETSADIQTLLTEDEDLVTRTLLLLKKTRKYLVQSEKKLKSHDANFPVNEARIQQLRQKLDERIERLKFHAHELRRKNMLPAVTSPQADANAQSAANPAYAGAQSAADETQERFEEARKKAGKKVDDMVVAAEKLLTDTDPNALAPEEIDTHRYEVIEQLKLLVKVKGKGDEADAPYDTAKANKTMSRLRARREEMKRQAGRKPKKERDAEAAQHQAEAQRLETRKNELAREMQLQGELARQRVEDAAPPDIMDEEQLETYASHLERHDEALDTVCRDAGSIGMPVPDDIRKHHRAVKQMRKKVSDLQKKMAEKAEDKRRQDMLDQALAPLRQLIADNDARRVEDEERRRHADEERASAEAVRVAVERQRNTLNTTMTNSEAAIAQAETAMKAQFTAVEAKIDALANPGVKAERMTELKKQKEEWKTEVDAIRAALKEAKEDIAEADDSLMLAAAEQTFAEKTTAFTQQCEARTIAMTQLAGRAEADKAAEPPTIVIPVTEVPKKPGLPQFTGIGPKEKPVDKDAAKVKAQTFFRIHGTAGLMGHMMRHVLGGDDATAKVTGKKIEAKKDDHGAEKKDDHAKDAGKDAGKNPDKKADDKDHGKKDDHGKNPDKKDDHGKTPAAPKAH